MYTSQELTNKFKAKAAKGKQSESKAASAPSEKKQAPKPASDASKGFAHSYKKGVASKLRPSNADGSPRKVK